MTEAEFLQKIEAADQKLIAEGIPPYQRTLRAFGLIVPDYSGPMMTSPDKAAAFPPLVGPKLLDRICGWYDQRYGERMYMPSEISKIPLTIKGEVFLARIPLVFGSPRLTAIDFFRLVDHLTPATATALSRDELIALIERWKRGYELVYETEDLRGLWKHRPPAARDAVALFDSALLDRQGAIRALETDPLDLPNACFHSQQLAEKMLKAFLLARGGMQLKGMKAIGHKLADLAAECEAHSSSFGAVQSDVAMLKHVTMDFRYSPPPLRVHEVAELVWAAYRIAGLAACEITGEPRRLSGPA